MTQADQLRGIDVSAWQGDVSQTEVRAAGYVFGYYKATEGIGYVSPRFAPEWREAREVGLYRGAYHFFHPLKDPVEQADRFVDVMGPIGRGDLPPALDFEGYNGIKGVNAPDAFLENALLFLERVRELTKREPIIYIGHWRGRVKAARRSADLMRYRLWLPSYTRTPRPMPWTNGFGGQAWTIWQHTGSGSVPGVHGRCDLNVFSGDAADLAALAGGAS